MVARLSIKILAIILLSIFMIQCSAVDRSTRPRARSTSPVSQGPSMADVQKEDYMGPKARVAVIKFVDKSAKGKHVGQIGDGMAEMLAHALFKTNRFIVLERQSLSDIFIEHELGTTGRLKQETAAEIGKIEGADLLVFGAITEFDPGTDQVGGEGRRTNPWQGPAGNPWDLLRDIKIRTSHVAMIVKMVETKTSRILASEQVEAKARDISGLLGLPGNGLPGVFSVFSKTPMEKAIRIAIEKAVNIIATKTPDEFFRHGDQTLTKKPPDEPIKPPKDQPTQGANQTLSPVLQDKSPAPPLRIVHVTASVENLRDKPQGKIIGQVNKGTPLIILNELENWLQVRLEDGREAWIWKISTSEAPKPIPHSTPKSDIPKPKSPM